MDPVERAVSDCVAAERGGGEVAHFLVFKRAFVRHNKKIKPTSLAMRNLAYLAQRPFVAEHTRLRYETPQGISTSQ